MSTWDYFPPRKVSTSRSSISMRASDFAWISATRGAADSIRPTLSSALPIAFSKCRRACRPDTAGASPWNLTPTATAAISSGASLHGESGLVHRHSARFIAVAESRGYARQISQDEQRLRSRPRDCDQSRREGGTLNNLNIHDSAETGERRRHALPVGSQ